MGFGTSATHIIFFIAAVVVATAVVGTLHTSAGKLSGGIGSKSTALDEELRTDLRIVNDPAEMPNDPLIVYAMNTGSRTMDAESVILLVNGLVHQDTTHQLPGGGDSWHPGEVIQLTANGVDLPGGDHRVRVVGDTGASDTLRFHVVGP